VIERLTDFPGDVVTFVCGGRVTSRDYENVLMPAVEAALNHHDKVLLYYQTGYDFSGVEPGVLQDFRVGMDHLLRWDRIAIVTDIDWIRETVRAFSFLLPGAVEVFPLDEAAAARAWIRYGLDLRCRRRRAVCLGVTRRPPSDALSPPAHRNQRP
jgi:hypothetical protein